MVQNLVAIGIIAFILLWWWSDIDSNNGGLA
jgi:hypothetical protein